MYILHVYRTFFPDSQGGLEETIRQICLATKSEDVETRVFSLTKEIDFAIININGIEVYRAPLHLEIASCGISLTCGKLFRELFEWADIVHYHFPWPFGDYLHLRQKHSKPTVVTYHSDIVRQRALRFAYRPMMHKFLSMVDRIVCTSPNYFVTSDTLSRFQDKVDIIPIGINEATYPAVQQQEIDSVVRLYGQHFFLFIGVLRYYKGLHLLLEAIKAAPYQVVIAGSGPTEKDLLKQATELGLDNVHFAGAVSNETKVALLSTCKGIIFPSYLRSEAFGVTLLEGAMFGKPLVSTEVGSGTSHVNVDQETGFVVSPGSPKSLRRAIDQLHFRPDLAARMGRNARTRYEKLFTGKIMGARYTELYRNLLGSENSSNSGAETINKVVGLDAQ